MVYILLGKDRNCCFLVQTIPSFVWHIDDFRFTDRKITCSTFSVQYLTVLVITIFRHENIESISGKYILIDDGTSFPSVYKNVLRLYGDTEFKPVICYNAT